MHSHQIFNYVYVSGVGSYMNRLTLARSRPDLRIHILNIYQVLNEVYFSGDAS